MGVYTCLFFLISLIGLLFIIFRKPKKQIIDIKSIEIYTKIHPRSELNKNREDTIL